MIDRRQNLPPVTYQGTFPRCVGEAFSALAHEMGYKGIDPQELYETAKKHDLFPGENYEGSDLSGGARSVELLGGKLNTLHSCSKHALVSQLSNSSVVVCVKTELLGITGGYHAMLVCGYNPNDDKFIVRNSWGVEWGDNGYTYPTANELEKHVVGQGYGMRSAEKGKKKAQTMVLIGVVVLVALLVSGFALMNI
jgi:hypothetical protein